MMRAVLVPNRCESVAEGKEIISKKTGKQIGTHLRLVGLVLRLARLIMVETSADSSVVIKLGGADWEATHIATWLRRALL